MCARVNICGVWKALKCTNCLSSYLLLSTALLFSTNCSCSNKWESNHLFSGQMFDGNKARVHKVLCSFASMPGDQISIMGSGVDECVMGHRPHTWREKEKQIKEFTFCSFIFDPITLFLPLSPCGWAQDFWEHTYLLYCWELDVKIDTSPTSAW